MRCSADEILAGAIVVAGMVAVMFMPLLFSAFADKEQRVNETCVRGHVYLRVSETGHKPYVVPALDDDGKPLQCGGAL
ncbi:hypothetical protein DDE01_11640 [Desulfovibrio desulfuricans]|nr:hypothetical protein DDE01_11640 [Desulfovibrio desulfuricans]